jgi:Ca2+-binding RTX toxin-like protein
LEHLGSVEHSDGTTSYIGLLQIALSYDDGSGFEDADDDISVFGNTLHGLASFTRNDGSIAEGGVGDVTLAASTFGWREVQTATGSSIEFEATDGSRDVGEIYLTWLAENSASSSTSFSDDAASPSTEVGALAGNYSNVIGDDRDNHFDASQRTSDIVLNGREGDDTLVGGSGGDLVDGGDGADFISAGVGQDVVFADSADGVSQGNVTGGEGYDQLFMAADASIDVDDLAAIGFEFVDAGDLDDRMIGTYEFGWYRLFGNGGNDTITTGNSTDVLNGGDGDDELSACGGSDHLVGGAGNDSLIGGSGNDSLFSGSGQDTLLGEDGNDYITVEGGGDSLYDGGAHRDLIIYVLSPEGVHVDL